MHANSFTQWDLIEVTDVKNKLLNSFLGDGFNSTQVLSRPYRQLLAEYSDPGKTITQSHTLGWGGLFRVSSRAVIKHSGILGKIEIWAETGVSDLWNLAKDIPNEYKTTYMEFFLTHALFEFVMKRSGMIHKRHSDPQANWSDIAKVLSKNAQNEQTDIFFDTIKKENMARIFFDIAPKKQFLQKNTELGWEFKKPPNNTAELIGCVTRVRNNLMHGEKTASPTDRDHELVKASLCILHKAIEFLNDRTAPNNDDKKLKHFLMVMNGEIGGCTQEE